MNEKSENKEKWRNIRYIKLSKAFELKKEDLELSENSSKISLGYFDFVEINELVCGKEDNWLETAWKHSIELSGNVSENIYEHLLYITGQGDKNWKAKIDDFWDLNTRFQMITFVHFVAQQEETHDLFSYVEEEIDKIILKNKRNKVNVVCYHSIDVSDMILIWKSDYLMEVFKCLRDLYFLEQIGNLHTICSFSLNNLSKLEQNETIPYISFRFGVKDANEAQNFLDEINNSFEFLNSNNPYITIGTEDVNIVSENVKVSDFLLLMKEISNNDRINKLFCRAFSESATHLGISYIDQKGESKNNENKALIQRCELLYWYFKKVRRKIRDFETDMAYSWVKQVSVQLNALISMSKLCALDRFCYLIMDSVQTFCELFCECIDNKEPITSERLRRIQKFVRAWGTLIDQTVRADGQFTQDIGVKPVFYNIPVSILEFYIAFTKRYMYLLEANNETRKEHGLFLMPNLCRRTKVEDIFNNSPSAKRLLYVDMPLDYMYKPRQMVYQICHEISHFCGDESRSRETRAQTFIMNCAQLIVQTLHIESYLMTQKIYKELYTVKKTDEIPYMRGMAQIVWEKMLVLLQDKSNVQNWIEQYLEEKTVSGRVRDDMRYERNFYYNMNCERIISSMKKDVERLVQLYTECYADISMIFLIQPSSAEYVLLYNQEQKWLDTKTIEGIGKYKELVQRIALILLTVFDKEIDKVEVAVELSELDKKLLKEAQTLAYNIKNGYCNQQFYLPSYVLRQIVEYLKYSYRKLNELYKDNLELEEIRKTFDIVTKDFSDATCEYGKTIYMYEQKIQNNEFWKNIQSEKDLVEKTS